MATTTEVGISVLIRTFNSANALDRLLSGIRLGKDDEYIVVDSGSADSTLSVASAYGAQIIQPPGRFNYSKSLNFGFRSARNPWVLVISSHSISMIPDLLGAFRTVARELSADVVVAYGPNTLNGRGLFDDDKVRIYTQENYRTVDSLCGNGNALYRRSVWEEIPFDETVRTAEDKIWMSEVFNKGYRICLASGARTMNRSQYSLRYMFLKGYSEQRSRLPRSTMSIIDLGMGLGSLTKRFLQGGMPLGNYIRYSACNVGRFFGSYQSLDNTPEK